MGQRWQSFRATIPGPFQAALLLAAGFMAFVAWDQSYWWRVKEDYRFGWLVPVFVAFVLHERWSRIGAALTACASDGSPRSSGVHRWLLRFFAAGLLVFGIVMFLLGALYRARAGTSQPGTLAITLGMIGIVLPLLLVNAPDAAAPAPATIGGDARLRLVGLFVFPVLVWLVSAPIVSAVETQLNLALLRRVVAVVAFCFDALGLPIEQQGNILVLPSGNVGIEDACSGIRSLTGCLFAGAFLGAVFFEQLWPKLALMGAALVLAFFTNLLRSLFLTSWAYHFGPRAIEGTIHDLAGYLVLGLTVAALLGLLALLNLRGAHSPPRAVRAEGLTSLS